jgi:hypothetical protein
MSVPNFSHVPQKLHATGLYNLLTDAGHDAFTDAVVTTCHGLDPNFRHLKKASSQTHIHLHGEDSMLYLLPNNQALAVDFIGGAGGPNPQPGWIVGEFVYKHSDAHDPTDHGLGNGSSTPAPALKPRDQFYREFQDVNAYYAAPEGLKRPGGMVIDTATPVRADTESMGAWGYDLMTGKTVEECKTAIRHSDEWKQKHPGEQP